MIFFSFEILILTKETSVDTEKMVDKWVVVIFDYFDIDKKTLTIRMDTFFLLSNNKISNFLLHFQHALCRQSPWLQMHFYLYIYKTTQRGRGKKNLNIMHIYLFSSIIYDAQLFRMLVILL